MFGHVLTGLLQLELVQNQVELKQGKEILSYRQNLFLKVPKCEIFDRSDFHYFYTIKPFWVDDFVVKILTYYFNFWGSQASFSF